MLKQFLYWLLPNRYTWAIITTSGKIVDDHGISMKFDDKLKARKHLSRLRKYFEQQYNEPLLVDLVRTDRR